MLRPILFLVIVLPTLVSTSAAQTDTARTSRDTLSRSGRDSVAVTGEYVMTKSPTTAVLLSLIPGGGQLYNEQYWKVPLFVGAAGFFAWQAAANQNDFAEQAAIVDTMSLTDPQRDRRKALREFYRNERDLNIAYYVGVEILCMIDAYVGAHLFDFNVEDISSRIYFDPARNGVGLMMRW